MIQQAGQWSRGEAAIIANVLGRGLTEGDLRAYAAICKHTGLDPFRKQIYAWKDNGRLTIHVSVGGWRAFAARTGSYAGQTEPQWCGPDGAWRDVWLEEAPPAAARVGVYRVGAPEAIFGVVTFREFARTQARTGAKGPTLWDEKPAHMLAVRAEHQALQKACPEAFAGVQEAIQTFGVTVETVSDEELAAGAQDLAALAENVNQETGEIIEGETRPIEPVEGAGVGATVAPPPSPVEGGQQPSMLAGDEESWRAALATEMATAGMTRPADDRWLCVVIDCPAGDLEGAIPQWLENDPGRTVHTLVSGAADRKAAAGAKR
ncbi:MAG: recombinase RecT, partial [Tepidiformaceae bacterium]